MMRAHQIGGAMSRLEAGDGSEVASLCLGEEAAAAPCELLAAAVVRLRLSGMVVRGIIAGILHASRAAQGCGVDAHGRVRARAMTKLLPLGSGPRGARRRERYSTGGTQQPHLSAPKCT